jgi:hypothetical protein
MPKAFASGTLVDVNDTSSLIKLEDKYTGGLGLLLTGTFGATGKIVLRVTNPGGADRNLKLWSPADASRTELSFTAPGLYYVNAFINDLTLVLSLGTVSVTDIDWTLFLKPRP